MVHGMAAESPPGEVAQLTELRDAYEKAENAGDVDAIMELCHDNIAFVPPEAPPVSGPDAVRAFFEEFLAAFDVSIDLAREGITVGEAVAYEWGTVSGSATGPDGESQPINNTYLITYERDADGSWKQSKNIWNTNE